MSDSLQPHRLQYVKLGLQHDRTLPCPSLPPGVCSNSCLLNWWCHPTISSSAALFFFCLQPFSESGPFPMSQYFPLAGQTVGTSALESVLPWIFKVDLFRIDCFDIFAVQGTLKSLFQHHSSKASILWYSTFIMVQLSHPYMTTKNKTKQNIALTRWTFVGKIMSLLFNMLSRFVLAFLPRSKCLLICGCNYHLKWFWSLRK